MWPHLVLGKYRNVLEAREKLFIPETLLRDDNFMNTLWESLTSLSSGLTYLLSDGIRICLGRGIGYGYKHDPEPP